MKKIIGTPIPNGGMPIWSEQLVDCLQSEIYRAITAPYLQYGEPVIISGCRVVDNLNGTCTITAGLAFLDGDIIDVAAYAGAYPVYLAQAAPVVTNKIYRDKISRATMQTKATTWIPAAPGQGDYIAFDPYTSQYLKDVRLRYETPLKRLLVFADNPNAAAFDVNGVGKWEWKGFAIPNGNGGTANLTGRTLVQFDPTDGDFALTNPFGEKKHQLTVAELARHDHITDMHPNEGGSGTSIGGQGDPGNGSRTSSTGGDQPHNNVQPSYAAFYLQRV